MIEASLAGSSSTGKAAHEAARLPMPHRFRRMCTILAAMALGAGCSDSASAPVGPLGPTYVTVAKSSGDIFPIGGDIIAIDPAAGHLNVQGGTVRIYSLVVTAGTALSGDSVSLAEIEGFMRAGYAVGVSGFGTGDSVDDPLTVLTLAVHKAGPFPQRIEMAFFGFGDLLGVPVFQSLGGSTIVQVPADAMLDPASPIASLEAARARIAAGQAVCVTADTFQVATANYRATSYAMRPSTTAPVCAP
jgi:hypothetical protein